MNVSCNIIKHKEILEDSEQENWVEKIFTPDPSRYVKKRVKRLCRCTTLIDSVLQMRPKLHHSYWLEWAVKYVQSDSLCARVLVILMEWKGLLKSSILSSQPSNSRMVLCIWVEWPSGRSEKLEHSHRTSNIWQDTHCRLLQWHNYRVQESLPSFAQLSAFPQTQDFCKVKVTRPHRYVGKHPFRCSPWQKKCKSSVARHSPVRISSTHSDLNVVSL